MEHRFNKAKTKKHKKIHFSIPGVLLFAYLMFLVLGCDDSSTRTSSNFNLQKNKLPWANALRIIQESLVDNDPLVRIHAIEVVASTGQLKLMPIVSPLLQDQIMPVRFAAALAVGDLEYLPAKRSVSKLLKDNDTNVIVAAAYSMGKLGSVEYIKVLRQALNNDNQKVRANAALLLGKIGDKSSLESLWSTMQDKNSDDRVIYQSAEAIAMLGDQRIYQKLWTMLISVHWDVRLMGVRAMGKLQTIEAKNALIGMLNDDILEVRLAAAEQLGLLNDPIGESKVMEVFQKNLTAGLEKGAEQRIKGLTALAIGQIRTTPLTKFLPQLLQNESKLVRIAAAKAVLQCTK
jgi:HEAT repeat protein